MKTQITIYKPIVAITRILYCLCFTIGLWKTKSYAQCPVSTTYTGAYFNLSASNGTQATSNIPAGQFQRINVIKGYTYEIYTCGTTYSGSTFDTQLSLFKDSDNSFLAYNNDACGTESKITWTATFTGVVKLQLNTFDCQSGTDGYTPYINITVNNQEDDPSVYGNESWIGYIYDGINFDAFAGKVTESENFNQNFGGASVNYSYNAGSLINAGSMHTNTFSVRYRMRKTFPCGIYTFTTGSDDGRRLSTNGGATWNIVNSWMGQGYSQTTSNQIYLNGVFDLVYEYYDDGADNQVSIQINNVTPALVGGSIGGITDGDIVCQGADPGAFTNVTGGSGGVTAFVGGNYQWESSTQSNSSGFSNISGQTGATYDPTGVSQTTWFRRRFYDACGSAYSNVIQVVVNPLTVICPASISLNNTTDQCGRTVTYSTTAGGTPTPTLTYSFSGATTASGNGNGSGSFFNVGITNVTVTAANICGSTACSFIVTITDNQPPSITTGTIANCYPTVAAAEAAAMAATSATDNCSGIITETASTVGTCSAVITVRETDANNNFATTIYNTRIDNTPPVATKGTLADCYPTVAAAEAAALAATTATDNCPGTLTETAATVGTCSAVITVTTTDGCGNFTTTTYNTRIDNTPPNATCPAPITVCSSSAVPTPNIALVIGVSDDCPGAITVTHQGDVNNCPACINTPYSINRTYRATDGCGNFTECTQVIMVNPIPNAMATPSTQTICSASAMAAIALSGNVIGTVYNWTRDNGTLGSGPVTGIASAGSGTISGTLVNTTGAPVTVTFTITPSFTNAGQTCIGTPITATVTVNPLPMATIAGTTTVCQNSSPPSITFTGSNGLAPYTFTYSINGGGNQTVTTTNGNSVSIPQSTANAGTFEYTLVSVKDGSSTQCSQNQSGTAMISVNGKPTITLNVQNQILNEGNNQLFCDTDANPMNGLQFTVTGLCVVGNPVWRVQVGSGIWSNWSTQAPTTQSSDNQPYRYQAACDGNCSSTYTNPMEVTINYRASTPQNVSLVADGTTVAAGESKTLCNLEANDIAFNATCAAGEMLLYSIDGGDYSISLPSQIVDNNFHNYRVRCRKVDGTPSCLETESAAMSLKITTSGPAPTVSISPLNGCGTPAAFSGSSNCGTLSTIWYNAATNQALPTLPTTTPNATTSFYARCQNQARCLSEKSNTVTFTLTPVNDPPVVSASADIVCTGTQVTLSANCPVGASAFWNTGVTESSFQVAFNNVTQQTYWAKCIFPNGCQSPESAHKTILWKAFELTFINIGQSQSGTKPANDRNLWTSQFITKDAGPVLENSTESNPTIYYSENVNKTAPRFWTIQVETCALGTDGSVTYDLLAAPEVGVVRSYNTHENNAPYLMYANREGFTELYAQNHPAYGFYQDNGSGGNTYDSGLPKGLYKLSVRYWDQKGQGSIYPATRQPAGNVLAYQEYWFRIQSNVGVGAGASRVAALESIEAPFAQVAPNPVSNTLRLKISEAKGQKVNVQLTDASGRLLLQRVFVPETHQHREELEISDLANGMYFMHVTTNDKQATVKVVKVR